jgi:hypothetical protein
VGRVFQVKIIGRLAAQKLLRQRAFARLAGPAQHHAARSLQGAADGKLKRWAAQHGLILASITMKFEHVEFEFHGHSLKNRQKKQGAGFIFAIVLVASYASNTGPRGLNDH